MGAADEALLDVIAMLLRHPGRVRSLTLCSIAGGHAHLPEAERRKLLDQRLVDVATLGPQRMAEKRAPRLLGPAAPPEALAKLIDTMGSVHPDGYAQAARMLSAGDIVADIARLPAAMPGQVIFGDADVITQMGTGARAIHRSTMECGGLDTAFDGAA